MNVTKSLNTYSDIESNTNFKEPSLNIKTIINCKNGINCVSYSPNGNNIVSGSSDNNIHIWDINNGHCIKYCYGHTNSITCISYSSNGKYIVSGSRDKSIRVWNTDTNNCIKICDDTFVLGATMPYKNMFGHTNSIICVAFSIDCKFIVSYSVDKTIRIWNTIDSKCIKIFPNHLESISNIIYSQDNKFIISNSVNSTMCIWDTDNGICIKKYTDDKNPILFSQTFMYNISGMIILSLICLFGLFKIY